MSINQKNLLKYTDILGLDAMTAQAGRTAHMRISIATGDGTKIATTGFALPATYDDDSFTAETAGHTDPRSREFTERHPAALHAHRAIADISALSAQSLKIGADSSLSTSGREAKVRDAVAATIGRLGTRSAAIDPLDADLKATEAKLLTPAEPDHGQIILDSEARQYWRGLDAREQRIILETGLGQDPALDRVLLALRRSPIPNGKDASKIDEAWRSMVVRTRPKEWQAYSDAREATTWAAGLVHQLAKHALNPAGRDRLDRATVYGALKPAGPAGLRLGGFQQYEVDRFEYELARAQAAA